MLHSILAPSSAARRVACPGSRALEKQYSREASNAASEGTKAHDYAATILLGVDYEDTISDEMKEHCNVYINHVKKLAAGGRLEIEKTIDISVIHPECFGTVDAYCVNDGVLHVIDFKYGFKTVEVFENWQLIEYAAGILDEEENHDIDLIIFHIVQPRDFNQEGSIRTWEIKKKDLAKYFKILQKAENAAMQDQAECRPSPECLYCAAKHACTALQQTALSHVDSLSYNIPHDLKDDQLGNELRILHDAAKMLKMRITALEEETLAKLKKGARVPFYELSQVKARERWKKPAEEIIALGETLDIDLKKSVQYQLITPKQAVKAGIPRDVIDQYSETPKGEIKLVATDFKKLKNLLTS